MGVDYLGCEQMRMCFRLRLCAMLSGVLWLWGCTGPVADKDRTPAGVIDHIERMPKRIAMAEEQTAVLAVVRSLPGAEIAAFQSLLVQDGSGPVRAFCGLADGLGPRGELTGKAQPGVFEGLPGQSSGKPANVSGMLKTVDGKTLAFDLRFGDFAAQRCRAMGFRFE